MLDAAGNLEGGVQDASVGPDARPPADAPTSTDAANASDASDAADGGMPEISLWNGVDLSEWEGDPSVWRVEGGAIVGSASEGSVTTNTFLIYGVRLFGDFVLRAQVWLGAPGNSGIQFRSSRVGSTGFVIAGYQADLGEGYWGTLYDERGRGILQTASAECAGGGRYGEWMDYEIQAIGPSIVQRMNGAPCVRFEETDASQPREGAIALQYHVPGGFEVRFRDLRLEPR